MTKTTILLCDVDEWSQRARQVLKEPSASLLLGPNVHWSATAAAHTLARREQTKTSIAQVEIVVDSCQWYALLGVVIGLPAP